MLKFLTVLIALLGSLFGNSPVNAHPGHSHEKNTAASNSCRIWNDASGEVELRGTFVAANNELVQIRREDDSLISLRRVQLVESDQQWVEQRMADIRRENESRSRAVRLPRRPNDKVATDEEMSAMELVTASELPTLLAQLDPAKARPAADKVPEIAKAFEAFVKAKAIRTRWDERFFYIESNGIPHHQMMVGITNWQQQVPIPQAYVGDNSWRVPLNPIPAKNPVSAKNHFLRGAIAIAANGVPIFNPLNNRGDDALLFGELDEFGGHCGRADDYHYHIAPVHLQKTVGNGLPIAYALDGYPIYGYDESDGSKVKGLDALNGHKDEQGRYHYHATNTTITPRRRIRISMVDSTEK